MIDTRLTITGGLLPEAVSPSTRPGRCERPRETLRPAQSIKHTQSVCRRALLSPALSAIDSKLREFDPSNELSSAWLREYWNRGTFSASAQTAIRAAEDVNQHVRFGAERAILLHAALHALNELATARIDPQTVALLCKQYEFFAEPGEDWIHRFDADSYSFRAYAGMSILQRFPAGLLDWEISGIPRSWLLKIPTRDLPRVLTRIAVELKGFKPVIFAHLAFLQTPLVMFHENRFRTAYLQIARCLALRPELKAITTAAWFHSPETHRVSPHLRWTNRLFEENGGIICDLGKSPADEGFLVGSSQRQKLYKSGDYKPRQGMILWPRDAVLDWFSKQPDAIRPW